MQEEFEAKIKKGAALYGLKLTGEMTGEFARFGALLAEKNRVMNLTAISDVSDMVSLHFLDSLALLTLPCVKKAGAGSALIDVGSGAGVPGLPLRIAAPQYSYTLLDSNKKKVTFTMEVCRELGFEDVMNVHARAEDFAHAEGRDAFDIATARALARLSELCELCMPLVKTRGYFVAMKSANITEEIEGAKKAILALGGKIDDIVEYAIPYTNIRHSMIVIKKIMATPDEFPRRYARIKRTPL